MAKVAFVCNGSENKNIIPILVLGSAAAASGDTVYIFFAPGAADLLKPGVIEGLKAKGYPDAIEMWNGIKNLGGKLYFCELAIDVKDMKKEDFRDDIELVGATTFMADIEGAQITFSF
ncbi:MAG: DsrE/DsrF/DrsH-like family protein [Candidatus Marinimicrobia bacterium]|jgi:predicted peroxiredoxin|nr:DsrE/DsrF/DrsH-like family protein [Candidatus Neomarinimicrobiota bacterium]MCK4716972.1 DsrE/DsrF/DrsH-like family protein [Candidatus Neomarinimicrobiota bacterium]